MHKSERQNGLIEIISSVRITRQTELVAALRSKGFAVTQASVSRDLDELGVGKVEGAYSLVTRAPRFESSSEVLSVANAGENLIVVCTRSGLASAVAVQIDDEAVPGIIGTIAGDDTIFIAVKDRKAQRAVTQELSKMFAMARKEG